MIHIPLFANRIAQFEALFEPAGHGYIYYGANRRGGLPLSASERDGYVTNYIAVLRTSKRVMLGWIILVVIGLLISEEGFHLPVTKWQEGIIFLLPFPWILWSWYRSKQVVLDEIGGRKPVSPPRSYASGVYSRVAAFPFALPVIMIGVGALLLVQLWRTGESVSHVGGLALAVGVIAFGGWILWIKRRAKFPR